MFSVFLPFEPEVFSVLTTIVRGDIVAFVSAITSFGCSLSNFVTEWPVTGPTSLNVIETEKKKKKNRAKRSTQDQASVPFLLCFSFRYLSIAQYRSFFG